jgi:hypothetical protein
LAESGALIELITPRIVGLIAAKRKGIIGWLRVIIATASVIPHRRRRKTGKDKS